MRVSEDRVVRFSEFLPTLSPPQVRISRESVLILRKQREREESYREKWSILPCDKDDLDHPLCNPRSCIR